MGSPEGSREIRQDRSFTIVVVDDHPLFAEGIASLVDALPEFRVVAVCTTAAEARTSIEQSLPDLIISDIDMPGMEIFSFIRRVRRVSPETAILVVTALSAQVYAERVIQSGAKGFIGKDSTLTVLESAVRVISQGGIWMPQGFPAGVSRRNDPDAARSLSSLSPRELEVFRHMGWGRPTREIAEVMHISPRTVATHRLRIYRKLGVSSTGALMRLAREHLNGEAAE
jgi:DNA-binding NarL/FixJ family response regulator